MKLIKTIASVCLLFFIMFIAVTWFTTNGGGGQPTPQPQTIYQQQPVTQDHPVNVQPAITIYNQVQTTLATAIPVPSTAVPYIMPDDQDAVAQPTTDWSDAIKAVTVNLDTAEKLVKVCAADKIRGATEIPPRMVDCSPVVNNLALAKDKLIELEAAVRAEK